MVGDRTQCGEHDLERGTAAGTVPGTGAGGGPERLDANCYSMTSVPRICEWIWQVNGYSPRGSVLTPSTLCT